MLFREKDKEVDKLDMILKNYVRKDDDSVYEIIKTAEEIIEDIFSNKKIKQIVSSIKKKDADLYDHTMTVTGLSMVTAIKMNMDPTYVRSIGLGALLHDRGLCDIKVEYRNKDREDFTPEDLFEFRKHTVYGFSSVETEEWMSSAAKKIVFFHHERLNGTGYPLKQTVIPPEVRIVSVCDTFDDMIRGIGYKQTDRQEALEYIKANQDIYFDSRIVDIFLQLVE